MADPTKCIMLCKIIVLTKHYCLLFGKRHLYVNMMMSRCCPLKMRYEAAKGRRRQLDRKTRWTGTKAAVNHQIYMLQSNPIAPVIGIQFLGKIKCFRESCFLPFLETLTCCTEVHLKGENVFFMNCFDSLCIWFTLSWEAHHGEQSTECTICILLINEESVKQEES